MSNLDIKDNGVAGTDGNGFEKGESIRVRIYVNVAADQEVVMVKLLSL